MIPKPNFFILGAPRCGTTALSEYLRSNPFIGFSIPKETQFFATDMPNIRIANNEHDYLNNCFGHLADRKYKAVGEASVWHLYSKIAVENILKFNPESKFIVMVRNPLQLVQALYEKQIELHQENCKTFEDAWKAQAKRKEGNAIPKNCRDVSLLMYGEIGKQGEQIERLLRLIPENRLKIVIFDDFIKNPAIIYREILEFLAVPDDGRDVFPKINEGQKIIFRWLYEELSLPNNHLMKLVYFVKSIFGIEKLDILPRLRKFLVRSRTEKAAITPDIQEEMRAHFSNDIVLWPDPTR